MFYVADKVKLVFYETRKFILNLEILYKLYNMHKSNLEVQVDILTSVFHNAQLIIDCIMYIKELCNVNEFENINQYTRSLKVINIGC